MGGYLDNLPKTPTYLDILSLASKISISKPSATSRNFRHSRGSNGVRHTAAHTLIEQVFPKEVLNILASDCCETISGSHPSASVFFSDIVGFTKWSSSVTPDTVCECLSSVFQIMDDLAEQFHIYKVETIGDAWMGVCGAPQSRENHAEMMATFAIEILGIMDEMKLIFDDSSISMRVGLHCGPLVSGVVRADRPRWQLFGDTVNTAARMESTSEPGRVQISSQMHELLESATTHFVMEERGYVSVKGKGELITYFLNGVSNALVAVERVQRLSIMQANHGLFSKDKKSDRAFLEHLWNEVTPVVHKVSDPDVIIDDNARFRFSYDSQRETTFAELPSQARECSLSEDPFLEHQSMSETENQPTDKLILLVDDLCSVLLQYQRQLRKIPGITVFIARNGHQALKMMKEQSFHVVFMDIQMPEMSGKECVRRLREWEEQAGQSKRQFIVALYGVVEAKKETGMLLSQGFDAAENKMHYKEKVLKYTLFERPSLCENREEGECSTSEVRQSTEQIEKALFSLKDKMNNKRVLVADGSRANRERYEGHLLKMGMIVHTASTVKEALDQIKERKFLIVFMGLTEPDASGKLFIDALREWEADEEVENQHVVSVFGSKFNC